MLGYTAHKSIIRAKDFKPAKTGLTSDNIENAITKKLLAKQTMTHATEQESIEHPQEIFLLLQSESHLS